MKHPAKAAFSVKYRRYGILGALELSGHGFRRESDMDQACTRKDFSGGQGRGSGEGGSDMERPWTSMGETKLGGMKFRSTQLNRGIISYEQEVNGGNYSRQPRMHSNRGGNSGVCTRRELVRGKVPACSRVLDQSGAESRWDPGSRMSEEGYPSAYARNILSRVWCKDSNHRP